MINFLFPQRHEEQALVLPGPVRHLHQFFIQMPTLQPVLVLQTPTSLSLFTPHNKLHHPLNHVEHEALHIFSKLNSFTVVTSKALHRYRVVRKDTLFSLGGSRGSLFPTLDETTKLADLLDAPPIAAACSHRHQVYLLHTDGALSILRPEYRRVDLGLPVGARTTMRATSTVAIVNDGTLLHVVRYKDSTILARGQFDRTSAYAIGDGKVYIGCGEYVEVIATEDGLQRIATIDVHRFGVMGDFVPRDVLLASNGAVVVNYRGLGLAAFGSDLNCTGRLWRDQRFGEATVCLGDGRVWAVEHGRLHWWDVQENVACDDPTAAHVVLTDRLTVVHPDGLVAFNVPPPRLTPSTQRGSRSSSSAGSSASPSTRRTPGTSSCASRTTGSSAASSRGGTTSRSSSPSSRRRTASR